MESPRGTLNLIGCHERRSAARNCATFVADDFLPFRATRRRPSSGAASARVARLLRMTTVAVRLITVASPRVYHQAFGHPLHYLELQPVSCTLCHPDSSHRPLRSRTLDNASRDFSQPCGQRRESAYIFAQGCNFADLSPFWQIYPRTLLSQSTFPCEPS